MLHRTTELVINARRAYLRTRHDQEGQTLVEYALLLAFIAMVVIVVLVLVGPAVSAVFQEVADELP
jgi:pilus assembly protein Flp/PilA